MKTTGDTSALFGPNSDSSDRQHYSTDQSICAHVETRVSKGQDVHRDIPGQFGTGLPVVPLSRDKKVSLSQQTFVPRQKKFHCPGVHLSRDKSSSKNLGTNSSFPGRPETSWDKTTTLKFQRFPVLEHPFLL